jgi:lactate dehydrogenase-like 2-hydroxyacid dehydrogenase
VNVVLLYELEQRKGFAAHNAEGIAFATAQLAAGASVARDMNVDAWRASANVGVGYPMVNVRDIESGKITLTRVMFGAD